MSSFCGFDLGDVAAVVSAITAMLAIIIGGRIQIRLARASYLRDIKEKRLIQLEESIAELLSHYNRAIFVLSVPSSELPIEELKLLNEGANRSNIIYSKLVMQLDSSEEDPRLILEYIGQISQLMFDGTPSIRPKLMMLMAMIKSQAQKIISAEREKLAKL